MLSEIGETHIATSTENDFLTGKEFCFITATTLDLKLSHRTDQGRSLNLFAIINVFCMDR